jgi:hypothetical protein
MPMRFAAALLFVAILLSGCGTHPDKGMQARFDALDSKIAAFETVNAPYNYAHLAKATHQYIALVREYADQLGSDEARQLLVAKGDELEAYCLPCKETLYDAARKY